MTANITRSSNVVAAQRTAFYVLVIVCVWLSGAQQAVAQGRLPGFGPDASSKRIRDFGRFSSLAADITENDVNTVQGWMKSYDKNRDGILDRKDTSAWGPGAVPKYDLNGDGILPHRELLLGYVRNRLNDAKAQQRQNKQSKKKAAPKPKQPNQQPVPVAGYVRQPRPLEVSRWQTSYALATELIAQYDRNKNKQLEPFELRPSGQPFSEKVGGADSDNNGVVSQHELAQWLTRRFPIRESARLAEPLQELDKNDDGQVSMAEYMEPASDRTIAEFQSFDNDRDGLISAAESFVAPVPASSIGFVNNSPKVINANSRGISDIWVNENLKIEDLKVRVAIAKNNDQHTRVFLIGPDRQRITLFAGDWQPWGGAFILQSTVFDDEAPLIEKTLPTPPFPRELRTDALKKSEPGLGHYRGKSTRGSWQLVVEDTRGNVGVLHHWSLWVRPEGSAR